MAIFNDKDLQKRIMKRAMAHEKRPVGRPKIKDEWIKKKYRCDVRCNQYTKMMLDTLMSELKLSRTAVLEKAIEELYNRLHAGRFE